MNIYDIAKKAGVSPATVSRVINNKPNISDRTYQKVQAVLKESNYIPNAIARGLVSNSMNLIGIIVDDIRNLYRSHIIYELSQLLNQHRYNTIIFDFGNQDNDLFNSLQQQQLDALIFIGSSFSTPYVTDYISKYYPATPVMMFNGLLDLPNAYSVICDEAAGMELIVEHLYRTGKKNFVYVNYSENLASQRKLTGFCKKLEEYGLAFDESRLITTTGDFEGGRDAAARLLQYSIPCDALVCGLDLIAMGAMYSLKHFGYSIPGDIAITGFDNIIYGKLSDPFLTSVDSNHKEMARVAIENLLGALRKEEAEKVVYVRPFLFCGGTS
ncbi:LacI family transcriptional regulator [Clostridium sp. AF18-27]|uniref:LacI family DNA-binding transcriptional regulator n=1 Tax=Enterocloster lavalensis TaxID=460384 RepID=UPI000E4C7D8B|nr:LacI family DNA-binding transcriptional regulator [Enterocloster lavalensis]RHR55227.1 LacI family transcriptional regulator [Clostridium sp. AF18-27]